jgi:hypothetical protein
MARRKGGAELQVRASFEATRIASQCLVAAYERLVPIPRRATRSTARSESVLHIEAAATSPQRRRAERG